MTNALETTGLGKRYGRHWALHGCDVTIPPGRIVALVGPNGAGKTTLLHLAVGLATPSEGIIRTLSLAPLPEAKRLLPRIGFVAQDHPLYRRFTVADMCTFGHKLNPRWDDALARDRLHALAIPLDRPTGKLSGGQQMQVALVLALAKRPEFLLLDEPLASLDPLARREFLAVLMDAAAEHGLTVLLSSHDIADLERVCDYLVILASGQVRLAAEIDDVVRTHRLLVGPRTETPELARIGDVVQVRQSERQTTVLVRANGHVYDARWCVRDVALEDIILAYLGQGSRAGLPTPAQQEEIPA